jgi:hypothetical protein
MTTHADQIRQEAEASKEAFFASLPPQVRLNTDLSENLKHHLLENSPKKAAYTLARCIEAKVWEGVAVLPGAGRHAKVNRYETPVQWMRGYLDVEPDELMQLLLGLQPDPKVAAGAALSLVAVVRETEPTMFRSLHDRWKRRLEAKADAENGEWTVACRQFDKATANPHGGDRTQGQDTAGRTLPSTRAGEGSTDAVARRLEKYLDDPKACNEKGTTQKRVRDAYDLFLKGRKQYRTLDAVKQKSGLWGETVREARCQVSVNTTAERLGQWLLKRWPKDRVQALTRYLMEHST